MRVKPHVLRYWEQEFTQLKPVKRRGNRRYYQHHEVLLIREYVSYCMSKALPSVAHVIVLMGKSLLRHQHLSQPQLSNQFNP